MKVLVIGNGGREHALAWKCAQSDQVSAVLVAPGNAGTALEPGVQNVAVAADDIAGLIALAKSADIGLTIVGPEAPLVAGVVDAFNAEGLACFGPCAAAAQLEGSKAFTKAFLQRHAIPTATYASFTALDKALAYIHKVGAPIVVKADGLAAGKGVIIARTVAEAEAAARDMLAENRFGDAGACIVVEEFLEGEEASFIVVTDGHNVVPMATSQDHKARDDGDTGPNTGGMGAYSPAPVVTPEMEQRIMDTVIGPTIRGLQQDGIPYLGFLYAGLMITADGTPKVLEFNCRFGDPETQPIMMRLQSDLAALCLATINGELDRQEIGWDERCALGVVMAAGGYPERYDKGKVISGLPEVAGEDVKVFHAGTALSNGEVVTSGGRVLCVVGLGHTVAEAQKTAYEQAAKIQWDGAFYRSDIGYRALAREHG